MIKNIIFFLNFMNNGLISIVWVRHLIMLISWMVILDSYLIWQIISCILPPTEYSSVYASTTLGSGPAIDLQKMPLLAKKNHLLRWSSFWSWRVCKQAKLSHLEHRKAARMHWKANAPKTSHCLVRIIVQRHNWAIFLRKWARRGRYSQWRSLSERMLNELLFTPPRSCDLTPLDYDLWSAVKDKCYADKPETIDALKDNISEAIGEIQLHTIDNVLKNWIDRVGYCMASQGSHLNEIIFHY